MPPRGTSWAGGALQHQDGQRVVDRGPGGGGGADGAGCPAGRQGFRGGEAGWGEGAAREDRCGMEEDPDPRTVPGHAPARYRAGVFGSVVEPSPAGDLRLCRVRGSPVRVGAEVRLEDGVAELLGTGVPGGGG